MISPLSPLDFLARSAYAHRDAVAVVDGDRRFTYAEFNARVNRLASALLALGVGPGDRVAVLAPNGAMALEAHFGPMRIGAILVMLNTRLAAAELADSQLLWGQGAAGRSQLRPLASAAVARACWAKARSLARTESLMKTRMAINYTSGTTGKASCSAPRRMGVQPQESPSTPWTSAASTPDPAMFHCNGWCFTGPSPRSAGAISAPGGPREAVRSSNRSVRTCAALPSWSARSRSIALRTPSRSARPAHHRARLRRRRSAAEKPA
jgi:fatty-acyl-CoA synthase